MTPEEQKEAEANGTSVLKEVRSDTPSEGTSEDIPPFRKRSRRRECIYIAIAVVLGAALIAVLVYFSVTNAMDEEPVEASPNRARSFVTTTDGFATTTDYYYDYEANIARGAPSDNLRSLRNGPMFGEPEGTTTSAPGGPLARGLDPSAMLRSGQFGGVAIETGTTTTTVGPLARGLLDPSAMLRSGRFGGVAIETGTTTTTEFPAGPVARSLPRGAPSGPVGGDATEAPTTTTALPREVDGAETSTTQ